jgi:hypothetical protein
LVDLKVTAENYEPLKAFFGWMVGHVAPGAASLPVQDQPLNVLSKFEAQSQSLARQSLQIGISDILEQTQHWQSQATHDVNLALTQLGLPTLSGVRLEFSKKIASILTRGRVRSEIEYYALRNVVEAMPDESSEKAWQMLAAFEEKVGLK